MSLLSVCKLTMTVYVLAAWTVPSSALSTEPRALGQISVNGKVGINGVEAVRGGSVFSGDRVATQTGSMAGIAMTSGGEIMLGESTSVEISHEQDQISVALGEGLVAYLSVATTPIVVKVGGIEVVPGKNGGVYVVELSGVHLRVTVNKGFAEMKWGNSTVRVAEGKTLHTTMDVAQGSLGVAAKRVKGRVVEYAITAAGIAGATALALSLIHTKPSCAMSPTSVGACETSH